MSNLVDIDAQAPFDVWGSIVRARKIEGEQLTFAVVELAPNATIPEHRHHQEQLGMVITGSMRFRIDDEVRELGPGGTWRILSNHPHEATAGPDGAVVIDAFSPIRSDWNFEFLEPQPMAWPVRPAVAGGPS